VTTWRRPAEPRAGRCQQYLGTGRLRRRSPGGSMTAICTEPYIRGGFMSFRNRCRAVDPESTAAPDYVLPVRIGRRMTGAAGTCHSPSVDASDRSSSEAGRHPRSPWLRSCPHAGDLRVTACPNLERVLPTQSRNSRLRRPAVRGRVAIRYV